ncbi:MAG: hypothetical protein WBM13_08900 [Bacteroidia bacterium]
MKTKLLVSVLFLSSISFAQESVNYEVIKDEPIEPKISVNLDLFNIDINTKVSRLQVDNISFNIGTFGHVMPLNFVGIDFNIHKAWLTLGKIGYKDYPGNLEMNVGGFFFFTDRTTIKQKTRVVLKTQRGTYNGKDVTTTTFIEVPAKIQKRFGVRAGLYQKSGPFNFRDFSKDPKDNFAVEPPFEYTKYSSFGLYGGLMWRRISNIIIKDPKYGQSGTSGATDIYMEAMVIPVNKFTALEQEYTGDKNVTSMVHNVGKESPIGFRIGFKKYQVEKKAVTGRKFGRAGIAEFGYRPYIGWFANAGVAITLVKSSKPLSFGGKEKTTETAPQ